MCSPNWPDPDGQQLPNDAGATTPTGANASPASAAAVAAQPVERARSSGERNFANATYQKRDERTPKATVALGRAADGETPIT